MNNTIVSAIQNKQLLSFQYDNVTRTVEPHTYGRDKKGNDVVSAWQLSGKSGDPPAWRLYEVSRLAGLRVLPQHFANARPQYKRNDSRMTTIYAQL
jgi:predicted DNA-binding transcriptional regulator YafY